jgi:hypothetical protein
MSIDQHLDSGSVPPSSLVDALDATDPAALVGAEAVEFAAACFRARNQATARFVTALHEACRAVDGERGRRALIDAFSGDEAAARLGWSRSMAGRWLGFAEDLLRRLPEVHAAMRTGDLEEAKARVFVEWTRDLTDDHAHHLCGLLLPEAPLLTVGALIERIQTVANALDPEWAARRQTTAEKRARVVASRNPSGTANLSGLDLPMDRTAIGIARLEALAAILRRRGVPIDIDNLRAEILMSLLDGTAAGLDDDTLLDLLTSLLATPDDEPDEGPGEPDGGGDGPDGPSNPDGGPRPDDGPEPEPELSADEPEPESSADEPEPDDAAESDTSNDGPVDDGTATDAPEPDEDSADDGPADRGNPEHLDEPHCDGGPEVDEPGESDSADDPPDPPTEPPARAGGVRDGTVELRLRLTTALGLDELPAVLPRWGTALASTARTMLDEHHRGEWRVVLTDDAGRLRHVLLARRRPRLPQRPPDPRRRRRRGRAGPFIVELQVPATVLAALDPDDHPGWAPLLRELQHRAADLADRPPGPPDDHLRPEQARHRRPSAEIDRWIRVRDRHCVAPSCRRPAHSTDIDHTWDHALGGPTLTGNLGAWCPHHHHAKHDAGWRVSQPEPGRFVITTRAGATYETRPKLIIEPLPWPRPDRTPRPLPAHERDRPERHPDDPEYRPGDALAESRRARAVDGHRSRKAVRTTGQLDSLRRQATVTHTVASTPTDLDPPPF